MLEAQQGFFAELPVAARNAVAQRAKPGVRAQRHAADARNLGGQRVFKPVMRHDVRGQHNPRQQNANIAHHAHEAGHERRVRMPFFAEARLDFLRGGVQLHRHAHGLRHEKFRADEQQEHEGEQFHGRLDGADGEERRKSREGDGAVNQFHRRRAEADEHRPAEAALRTFVEDGEVDRPDGNCGEQQRGDETGERGVKDGQQFGHQLSGSSSSSSISRRHARERRGRTKP